MLTPARAVEREFTKYFSENVGVVRSMRLSRLPKIEQGRYKRRLKELHPSSFPYCAYRHAYEALTREDDPLIQSDFGFDYFTGAGTHFHNVIQDYLGYGGQILGNYKCVACSHVHELTVVPKRCTKCKSRLFQYQEVGGRWGRYVHWHKDGLFRDSKGRYWIIDYKTTSTSAIWEHKKSGVKFPYLKNRVQIESYIPLAEDAYGVKVAGWMLIYCARDFPHYSFTPVAKTVSQERKDEIRARLTKDDRLFGVVLGLQENPEHIGRIRKGKLCEDREFYKANVYDRYDPCPLAGVCFKSKKAEATFANAFKGIPINVEE